MRIAAIFNSQLSTLNFQLFLAVMLTACAGSEGGRQAEGEEIAMRHARQLTMTRCDDVTYVNIRNPWDSTKLLHRYALVPDTLPSPTIQAGITLVRTPLRRAAVYTSIHAALIDELGCVDQIGGVCDAGYISNAAVLSRVADGRILDYGSGLNPSLELIMDSQPDALMPSPFENAGYGRVEKLGIPIIECADYMETSPLGRAEWLRFYGLLFGCEEKADSLFASIEQGYLSLRDSVQGSLSQRPRVMCDMQTSATWYVPGARSTMGQLIADAGGDYIFSHLDKSGSVALSVESVLDRAHDADIWLIKYNAPADLSYDGLASAGSVYTRFKPFGTRRIYGCNTAHTPYFEDVSFHPDLILRNLAEIFAGRSQQNKYYKALLEKE